MSRRSGKTIYALFALGALALAPAMSAEGQERTGREELATMAVESGTIAFRPSTGDALTLKVVGESYRSTQRFAGGETPSFTPVDREGFSLPDGLYKWELVANPRLPVGSSTTEVKPADGRASHRVAAPDGPRQFGAFTILNGRVVDSTLVEEPARPGASARLPETVGAPVKAPFDDSDLGAPDAR